MTDPKNDILRDDKNILAEVFSQKSHQFGTGASSRSLGVPDIRDEIVGVFKYSESDNLFGIGDISVVIDKEKMEQIFKHYGARASDEIRTTPDPKNTHDFEIRMHDHGKGEYTLALYEHGQHVGTARTPGLEDLSPKQIYAENPLGAPTAQPATPAPGG